MNPTVILIWLLVGFQPATRSVQSTPADNIRKRVWQYIEKEMRHKVKPVKNGHSKIDKIKTLMTNSSLMKVESIVECSKGSILQYF